MTGAHRRTFEDFFHRVVVIVIEPADLLGFSRTLQLSVHITILRAVVRLHAQAAIGPQLPLSPEPMWRLHQGQKESGSKRADARTLA